MGHKGRVEYKLYKDYGLLFQKYFIYLLYP